MPRSHLIRARAELRALESRQAAALAVLRRIDTDEARRAALQVEVAQGCVMRALLALDLADAVEDTRR